MLDIRYCIVDIISKCDITPGYRSDHSNIEPELTINSIKIGEGIWKFNNSLLQNQTI